MMELLMKMLHMGFVIKTTLNTSAVIQSSVRVVTFLVLIVLRFQKDGFLYHAQSVQQR